MTEDMQPKRGKMGVGVWGGTPPVKLVHDHLSMYWEMTSTSIHLSIEEKQQPLTARELLIFKRSHVYYTQNVPDKWATINVCLFTDT